MPVQILRGFKPLVITLSTRPQWKVTCGPFLSDCTKRTHVRKIVRGQRELKAYLSKLNKPQHVLEERAFVMHFCTRDVLLDDHVRGWRWKNKVKLVHLLQLTLRHQYQNLVLKDAGQSWRAGIFPRRKTLKVINQELVKRTIALLFLPKNRMTKPNPSVAGMGNRPTTTPVGVCKNVVLPW